MSTSKAARRYTFPSSTYYNEGDKALFGSNGELEIYYENGIGYIVLNGVNILKITNAGLEIFDTVEVAGDDITDVVTDSEIDPLSVHLDQTTPQTLIGKFYFPSSRHGSTSHYTDFDTTGHQTMVGNAKPWRDELGDALSVQRNGAGITLNIAESTVDFDYNAAYNANPVLADMLYKNVQLNHDKDLAASVYPHIHWMQAKNYTPNFLFEYRWQKNGGTKVTGWTKLKCNNLAFPYVGGTTMHQISYSAAIAVPVGTTLSDVIQFRIYRDTTNASLEFTGTCPYNTGGNASTPVLSFDLHFQINSLGSTDELTK